MAVSRARTLAAVIVTVAFIVGVGSSAAGSTTDACPSPAGAAGHAFRISPCTGPLGTTFTATSIDSCPPSPDGSLPAVIGSVAGPMSGGFTQATVKPDGSWTWSFTVDAPPPDTTPATPPPGGGIYGSAVGPFTGIYSLSLACTPAQAFDKPYFTYVVQQFNVTATATPTGTTAATTTGTTSRAVQKSDGIADVPDPGQLDLSISAIATSFGFAGLMVILLIFATRLIDSTLESNWETLRRWPVIRVLERANPDEGFWSTRQGYLTFLAAATLLVIAWHPSLQRVGDAIFGVVVGTLVRSVVGLWFARRRYRGEYRGYLHARPASLAIASVALASSWLVGLNSPIIFGILAGAAFRPTLSRRRSGELTAFVSLATAAAGIVAWFVRWALRSGIAHPGVVVRLVESGLSVLLLGAVWGLALGMAPLRYFPGATVRAWKPAVWLTAWLVGMTFAVHVPLSDYGVSSARGNDHWRLLLIESVVLMAAVLFWASFALRRPTHSATASSLSAPKQDASASELEGS